jgi:hypothetical protein
MTRCSTPCSAPVSISVSSSGDHGLATLQREALLAGVLAVQELLELLRRDHQRHHAPLLLHGEVRAVARGLHVLDEPLALGLLGDVEVLDGEGAGVRVRQRRQELLDGGLVEAAEARLHHRAQIALGDAELRQSQQRVRAGALAERVEVGHQVAVQAVRVHEVRHVEHVARPAGPARIGGRAGPRGRRALGGVVEAGEVDGPHRVDRRRVVTVLLVDRVDVRGARSGDDVERIHSADLGRRAAPETGGA